MMANQFDRAVADLDEALRRKPSHGDARHNRGVAFADFRKALEINPADKSVKGSLEQLGAAP